MHANEALIREFYERQGRLYAGEAGSEAVETLLSDEIVWHVPGRSAISGEYRGKEAVLEYFARRRDLAHGSFRVEIRNVLADDEFVMQLAGGRAEIEGETREWETVGVYRIRDGRIAECWLLPFDQYAFDDIWS